MRIKRATQEDEILEYQTLVVTLEDQLKREGETLLREHEKYDLGGIQIEKQKLDKIQSELGKARTKLRKLLNKQVDKEKNTQ